MASPVFYTVKEGDTLSQIAERFLGDWRGYGHLFFLNERVIRDHPGHKKLSADNLNKYGWPGDPTHWIFPGQKLWLG